ncbi:MAG: hypothetical protein Tsb0026_17890 [Sulfuricaulis sp.]
MFTQTMMQNLGALNTFRHSDQGPKAREPESRKLLCNWIPAFAGMTATDRRKLKQE